MGVKKKRAGNLELYKQSGEERFPYLMHYRISKTLENTSILPTTCDRKKPLVVLALGAC